MTSHFNEYLQLGGDLVVTILKPLLRQRLSPPPCHHGLFKSTW
nr:MAG TPA: hypothetical protein [Caudoviricetes sp.]